MSNVFGWDLPPGVTEKMIDDQFGPGLCQPCDDGDHEGCEGYDCPCGECEQIAIEIAEEIRWEEDRERRRLH